MNGEWGFSGESEGEALEEWSDEGWKDDIADKREAAMAKSREAMKQRYEASGQAKVGSTIQCAFCGRRIVKTTYHKRFCTNGKTKKRGNCKDKYWNSVDETRNFRMRMQ